MEICSANHNKCEEDGSAHMGGFFLFSGKNNTTCIRDANNCKLQAVHRKVRSWRWCYKTVRQRMYVF
jgi:hypothetical protein